MDIPTCGFYRYVETEDGIAAECECGWQSTEFPDLKDSWAFEFQMYELGEHVMEAWA